MSAWKNLGLRKSVPLFNYVHFFKKGLTADAFTIAAMSE
ncbi:hypothetical protein RV07_GL002570 [Enterococcus malodoratus]|nr:hypothetical protein RV07_GL002570 [Enterococcus malodoratus]